jgi:type 1 glutamine amidotransferase
MGTAGLLGAAPPTLPEPPAEGAKVLLVTGMDYPGHPWRQTAPTLKNLLEQDPRLKVRIVENPHALASPQLAAWDVVILHFQNWQTNGPGPEARTNLLRLVTGGKGMMMTHFACGAWYQEWPEFVRLAGRVWFGPEGGRQHDPHGKFTVEITEVPHPITRGLQAFETVDELYTCLTGDTPIRVLAQARSKVDQKYYPMAFVVEPGRGRVFHTVLGHDVQAYTNHVAVGELLRRGCAWAAGLPPVP